RAPGNGIPEEVLRVVPRPRALSACLQGRADATPHDRGGRVTSARGRARRAVRAGPPRGDAATGGRGPPGLADLDLRGWLACWGGRVAFPDEPEPLQRQEWIDAVDRPRVRGDQLGQSTRGDDRRRLVAELCSNTLDDA